MKILIVDDEALVRKSLTRACRARGHEVIEAVDGVEGLARWMEVQPDLVFLDVLMPGMSGPEVLQAVAKENVTGPGGRRARVILISAYSGEHDVDSKGGKDPAEQSTGADLFIPKPFDDIFAVVAKAEALASGLK